MASSACTEELFLWQPRKDAVDIHSCSARQTLAKAGRASRDYNLSLLVPGNTDVPYSDLQG